MRAPLARGSRRSETRPASECRRRCRPGAAAPRGIAVAAPADGGDMLPPSYDGLGRRTEEYYRQEFGTLSTGDRSSTEDDNY